MANYSKSTNFASKDALLSGDPLKVIKGTEIDDEFEAIETAMATKADLASPTFTGTPKAPTAAAGTNTTQLATTAFVDNAVNNLPANSVCSTQIGTNCVTADELNVTGNGTAGQVLISDADGSFSWYTLPSASTSNPFISPSATDPTTRDDGSALQEGDIYYNTTDDVLKAYDGSAWNEVAQDYDPAAGETGTTSTPAIGAIVYGRLAIDTALNGDIFAGGYGSTLTANSTYYISSLYRIRGDGVNPLLPLYLNMTTGTWRLLGMYSIDSGYYVTAVRTA